jgi:hypothetical protein
MCCAYRPTHRKNAAAARRDVRPQRHAEIARRSRGRTSAITLRELQLSDHARHCMQGKDAAPRDPEQQVDELMSAVGRLLRH